MYESCRVLVLITGFQNLVYDAGLFSAGGQKENIGRLVQDRECEGHAVDIRLIPMDGHGNP